MDRGAHPTRTLLSSRPSAAPSALALALGAAPPAPRPAALIGLEHEYSLFAHGRRVDFRELIDDLPVGGQRLDPGDRNARRLLSGLVLTCDAEDAEVVSPPVPVQPGFTGELEAWAAEGRTALSNVLPPDIDVVPFSTHLSAAMPDETAGAACALFAVTFAPALMLFLDGPGSSGVFVRPRPGRLELCGEHAGGARLRAAAALVAGGARTCAAAGDGLPPRLAVDVRPATGRYGLFVGRHLAFGFDLYAAPRTAALPLAGGGTIAAQDYLDVTWRAVGAALGADAGAQDLATGDAMVAGTLPLGVEGSDSTDAVAPRPPSPSPFGAVLGPRHRPGFGVTAEAATWDFTILRLHGGRRDAFASVPGATLDVFLHQLDAGRLDGLLLGYLDADPTGRVLHARHQALVPDLWDDAVIGAELLPFERSIVDPGTPLVPPEEPAPAVPPPAAAPAAEPAIPSRRPQRRPRRAWALGALLALVLAVAAAAATGAFSGGGPAKVEVGAGPAASTPTTLTTVPPTTGALAPPTTVPAVTTIASTSPPPTTAAAVVTTQAVATTAALATSTSTPSTATTSTVAAPSQLLVAATPTALGCGFTPPSATGARGSSIRFRNDTPSTVNLTVTPPAGAATTISVEQGSTSATVPLTVAGAYTVTCSQGDAGVPGRLTVTVTG